MFDAEKAFRVVRWQKRVWQAFRLHLIVGIE